MDGPQKWIFLVALFIGLSLGQDEDGNNNITFHQDPGPQLNRMPCKDETDCQNVEGAYCDQGTYLCTCKPDFMVTDTHNCYKESNYEEFCRMDIQCQRTDENMRCNLDLNLCQCQPRFEAKTVASGGGRKSKSKCVESENQMDSTGAYYDPALFGIMGGLALMFIVICVVLQMFAKAQFRENRTIFNTPNPRLMNVSLMKDKAKDRKSSGNAGHNFDDSGGPREPREPRESRESRKRTAGSALASTPAGVAGSSNLGNVAEEERIQIESET